MANAFNEALSEQRDLRAQQNLQRQLRFLESPDAVEIICHGRSLINFASNDYLGLSQHPKLKEAAIKATEKYGAGAGAARLICGTLPVHRELEETIASFKQTEAALAFSTGYAAATGAIPSLAGSDDILILDKLVHASLVDGARLSGAKLRVFKHNNLADLESKLDWAARQREAKPKTRILVVTESVFSMDGDLAPLAEIVQLKDRYEAWLMVDEAHALGVLGPNRRGLAEQLGVADRIEIQMGTLGKAAGASGGFIAGSKILIDHLINSARSFIFSTAPIPAAAAAAKAGLEIIAGPEGEKLRSQLFENIALVRKNHSTAIIPIILGDEGKALESSAKLEQSGFLVPAIRYPTVARGAARLRATVGAAHTSSQITRFLESLRALAPSETRLPNGR